ncbi:hypothetical protein LXL04_020404 [Taraxacum kok-saghyz]
MIKISKQVYDKNGNSVALSTGMELINYNQLQMIYFSISIFRLFWAESVLFRNWADDFPAGAVWAFLGFFLQFFWYQWAVQLTAIRGQRYSASGLPYKMSTNNCVDQSIRATKSDFGTGCINCIWGSFRKKWRDRVWNMQRTNHVKRFSCRGHFWKAVKAGSWQQATGQLCEQQKVKQKGLFCKQFKAICGGYFRNIWWDSSWQLLRIIPVENLSSRGYFSQSRNQKYIDVPPLSHSKTISQSPQISI